MSITNDQLIANGFKPVNYDGQEGTFYTKILKASAMPRFSKHVVDGETVFDTDNIVVEILPNGSVQLVDQDSDYVEEAVSVDSQAGCDLLEDAGFVFN